MELQDFHFSLQPENDGLLPTDHFHRLVARIQNQGRFGSPIEDSPFVVSCIYCLSPAPKSASPGLGLTSRRNGPAAYERARFPRQTIFILKISLGIGYLGLEVDDHLAQFLEFHQGDQHQGIAVVQAGDQSVQSGQNNIYFCGQLSVHAG